jgi:hypothetical protein
VWQGSPNSGVALLPDPIVSLSYACHLPRSITIMYVTHAAGVDRPKFSREDMSRYPAKRSVKRRMTVTKV